MTVKAVQLPLLVVGTRRSLMPLYLSERYSHLSEAGINGLQARKSGKHVSIRWGVLSGCFVLSASQRPASDVTSQTLHRRWKTVERHQRGPAEERATSEEVEGHDVETLPVKDGDAGTRPPAVVVVVETLASPIPSSLPAVSRPASRPVSRPLSPAQMLQIILDSI
eukprot:gene6835-4923_t